jgi:hypothetical protein
MNVGEMLWSGLNLLSEAFRDAYAMVGKIEEDERVQVMTASPAEFIPIAGQKFHSVGSPTVLSSANQGWKLLNGQPNNSTR